MAAESPVSLPCSPPEPPRAASVAVVVSASLAMAATLPGRTHGLGLITSRLLDDIPHLTPTVFSQINLVATLLGSLTCLPCGWFIDRWTARPLLLVVILTLAGTVYGVAQVGGITELAIAITATRAIGQSMLSVVSITMLSKWFHGERGLPMAGYAILMTMLMAVGTGALAARVSSAGWRASWTEQAIGLAVIAPCAWGLFTWALSRMATRHPAVATAQVQKDLLAGASLSEAMRNPFFWVVSLGISLFGMVSSGVSLFQQLILAERGLSEETFHVTLVIGLAGGLMGNFIGGWAQRKLRTTFLLAGALSILAASLAALPVLRSTAHAYGQAIVSGFAGGVITVLFFGAWTPAFGARHVGRIQSVAQMMTVLASAVGPLVVAWGRDRFGSYLPMMYGLAAVAAVLALAALPIRPPKSEDWSIAATDCDG